MPYVPLQEFLFRAPLLPLRALAGGQEKLWRDPRARAALELASPDLAAAVGSAGQADNRRAGVALDRYRRRAAFRPTPHGLWAGVGMGTLGDRTRMATAEPHPVFGVSWKRLADLGRALLDDAPVRTDVRLRRAPSVIVGGHTVIWLGPARDPQQDGLLEEKRADLDDLLIAILESTRAWAPWGRVRSAAAGGPTPDDRAAQDNEGDQDGDGVGDDDDDEGIDEVLLTMIDDGLLHVDLVPPLIGPPPLDWMLNRLGAGRDMQAAALFEGAARELSHARLAAQRGDRDALARILAGLPGAPGKGPGITSTLLFNPPAPVTVSRTAVERAAGLAPLLFALQEALAPPASERTPAAALADALDATTEIFGNGALDLAALQAGEYGVSPDDDAVDGAAGSAGATPIPPRALTNFLVDAIVNAAAQGAPDIQLRADDLAPLLPETDLPPTCELFLTPSAVQPGRPPGDGWLVGLHAPAGATWGRFAHPLGERAVPMFEALRLAEQRARPAEERLDVLFAPSDGLADICAHPPLRAATLALTGWPASPPESEGERQGQRQGHGHEEAAILTAADLELCADPAALDPLALRAAAGAAGFAQPVAPSPLHRVRSSMAPTGIWRLLVGWSLYRQHAPWALTLGALADLEWTPRISIDGFVVGPASWRIPRGLLVSAVDGTTPLAPLVAARALRAWRKRHGIPRHVQVGAEDELLPVDLAAKGATADLAGAERVFEIWPPLGETPDQSGRRVEVVVALVEQPDAPAQAHIAAAIAATRCAGVVPPPGARQGQTWSTEARWETFKLFGTTDRQDAVLMDVVAVVTGEARAAGEIAGWFFLRYVDGPGRRPHLRLRVRLPGKTAAAGITALGRFQKRLRERLNVARATGDVVAVETTAYFPESARFGGAEVMSAVHAIFEADSDLACALLAADADPAADPAEAWDGADQQSLFLVCGYDALARGLGLGAEDRLQLARRRRDAHAADVEPETAREFGRIFRRIGPRLRALLSGGCAPPVAAALARYQQEVAGVAARLTTPQRRQMLPPLLHLSAVRLLGLDRAAEIRAYDFWARTLDSLERHQPR